MPKPEVIEHDVVVVGTGIAGLRAAVEIKRRYGDKLDVGLVSKIHLMRSHSISAEGGTAAVIYKEEGDSYALHAWDTIKGSDFLADQDAVWIFVKLMPEEVRLLEHWGMPWSRSLMAGWPSGLSGATASREHYSPATRRDSTRCTPSTTSSSSTTGGRGMTSGMPPTSWWRTGSSGESSP